MKKWKVAVLEDNRDLLKDIVELVHSIEHYKPVVYSNNSIEFIEKVQLEQPDFLLLDIELINDSMTGLDVAKKLNLPTIFVSGKNAEHLRTIESLKFDHSIRIDFISKPYNDDHLKKLIVSFSQELERVQNSVFIRLKYDGEDHLVPISSIVCIGTDKNENSESNNKVFYFNDRPKKTVADFSFKTKIDGIHSSFFMIHKSFRINPYATSIFSLKKDPYEVTVNVMGIDGKIIQKTFPVSDNYFAEAKRISQSLFHY